MSGLMKLASKPWQAFAGSLWGKGIIITVGAIVLTGLIALSVLMLPALALAGLLWVVALRRAWEPAVLRNLAIGIGGPLVVATMVWNGSVWAPVQAYCTGLALTTSGDLGAGLIETSTLWVPVGLVIAMLAWAGYRLRMTTGRARTLEWGERHQHKHKDRRMKRARADAAAPAPLITRDGHAVIVGPASDHAKGVTRGLADDLNARHPKYVTVPLTALQQHMAIVGDSGSGKTTLMRRLGIGAAEAMWRAHAQGTADRPLVLMIDCKGGPKAAHDGTAWIDDMIRMGVPAARSAVWPFTARLNIWSMAPTDLAACLQQMVRASHEHFDELRESLLHLVIDAEGGPPRSSLEFLKRINPEWLKAAWAAYPVEREAVEAVISGREPAYQDALLKYGNLFRHLGASLDAGHDLNDYDALYVAIAGTKRPKEAQAQATAVFQLVNDLLHRHRRQVLILLDEYSAVSGGVGIGLIEAVERWRSLGASIVVGAQSWEGLAETDDERKRLINTCSGGRLLMRSTDAESLSMISGTVKRAEASQHIKDSDVGSDGSFRVQDSFAVPPQRIREMAPGDVAYATGGGVTWGRVSLVPRLSAPPLSSVPGTPMLPPAPAVPLAELTAGLDHYTKPQPQGPAPAGDEDAPEALPTWTLDHLLGNDEDDEDEGGQA